jgi:hypothetical protein
MALEEGGEDLMAHTRTAWPQPHYQNRVLLLNKVLHRCMRSTSAVLSNSLSKRRVSTCYCSEHNYSVLWSPTQVVYMVRAQQGFGSPEIPQR